MNKKIKTLLQYLFFFGLGFLFIWLSVKNINQEDWKRIKDALNTANYYLIIPVFIILISGHYVRALRWRLLMEPLGYRPKKSNTFFAVMIGYLANQGVPRLGEVLKCTVLAKYEKIPADKLVGTIILERLIDAVSLLIVFGITLGIQPGLYTQIVDSIFNTPGQTEEKKISGLAILLIGVAGIILIIGLWMLIKKKTIGDVKTILKNIASRVWQGLGSIRHMKKRGQFVILTVILWGTYLAGGYIGFQALQQTQHYGIREAFTILSAGSIGMIISPGGIGGYALLIEGTMTLYGLQQSIAAAFGWLLWMSQTFVVLVGGLVSFGLLPWVNKGSQKTTHNIQKT
ncbi:flippase-like domain-containing protein [Terrimonas sp. NA20]|uniref:Flippase-like domain-containing protein n=1 Tax=Terrimonas ginsenosidimutans TaxID=2908004 RepID=A0ABS9KWH1_9BACT|nr:lysylphosphatidylglycerol synthase transmembrane domain-containing protein [Terrimonas ginsenosidimutans]MCG2616633.1 flippase-like domain-containing protein [Terrimonas ginsenosidimutans]